MTSSPPTGLRERKKARTRAAIREAAMRLFTEQGFAATTVDQIAEAAEVSQSTFFRYFPTKEAAALGGNRAFDLALAARLEQRVGTAGGTAGLADVEAAVADVLAELAVEEPGRAERMLRVRCLVMADAALRGALVRMDAEHARRFLERIAAATGSPRVDLRTRVVAETVSAGLRAALDEWASRREAGEDAALVDVYRATCACLREVARG